MSVGVDVESRPVIEGARFAGEMNPGDEPAELLHDALVIEVGRPSTFAG